MRGSGGETGQSLEAAHVLEQGGEGAALEEGQQAELDRGGVQQRVAPLTASAPLGRDVVGLLVLVELLVLRTSASTSASGVAATASASSLTPQVFHSQAEPQRGLRLVSRATRQSRSPASIP